MQGVHEADRVHFDEAGYVVLRSVFSAAELTDLRAHYLRLHARGHVRGCFEVDVSAGPAGRWPRMMQPHRVDPISLRLLLEPRLMGAARDVVGGDVLAAQSMWYWKAPGTRGQALHQDDYYVRTAGAQRPDSGREQCVAAWLAVDATDAGNGCLHVVPGSHREVLQCPHPADPELSFSRHEVTPPTGSHLVDMELAAGDVLLFAGRLMHGSLPNRSADRTRATFIAHYLPATATGCAADYQPLFDASGRAVELAGSDPASDPCGGPEY